MKEQLISFETAKLAKEKGFDWDCIHAFMTIKIAQRNTHLRNWNSIYDWSLSAPTQSLLQKWLRENFEIDVTYYIVPKQLRNKLKSKKYGVLVQNDNWNPVSINIKLTSDIPEEVIEEGLQEALKLI